MARLEPGNIKGFELVWQDDFVIQVYPGLCVSDEGKRIELETPIDIDIRLSGINGHVGVLESHTWYYVFVLAGLSWRHRWHNFFEKSHFLYPPVTAVVSSDHLDGLHIKDETGYRYIRRIGSIHFTGAIRKFEQTSSGSVRSYSM
jgi:hypothetical protein